MAKVFTPSIIAEIVRRAGKGESAGTIATDLGLNVASLRVKCSQLGISFRKCRAEQAGESAPQSHHATNSKAGARDARSKDAGALKARADCIPMTIEIPRLTFMQLCQLAEARGLSAKTLAAELLAVIGKDNLCGAVLDHDLK